ncbi:MAG: SDR family oxidoreductase [Myxococcota bacterium]
MSLKGRVAVITGASRGIGRVIALALARQGVDVVLAAKTVEPHPKLPGTLLGVKAEVEALGVKALAVQTDVRDETQIERLRDETQKAFGRCDILINNAGALWWKNVLETPAKRFDLVVGVNARAAFLCAQAFLPLMMERKWGHIINMSPPIDLRYAPGHVAYLISKYGMTLLTHGLAEEVRDHNIAVHSLWPATAVESEATRQWGLGDESQWRKADILADATLALVQKEPSVRSGKAWIDEDVLKAEGVTDFEKYNCVPGGTPLRIDFLPTM